MRGRKERAGQMVNANATPYQPLHSATNEAQLLCMERAELLRPAVYTHLGGGLVGGVHGAEGITKAGKHLKSDAGQQHTDCLATCTLF